MKKLLCVWGASNYGKTTAIIEFDTILNCNFKGKINSICSPLGQPPNDICRIYSVQYKEQTYIIGIESQGDPNSRQQASLDLFLQKNCDIIVCASRTRGEIVSNVENFCSNYQYDSFWISTLYSVPMYNSYRDQMKKRTGKMIFDVVSDFMDGIL